MAHDGHVTIVTDPTPSPLTMSLNHGASQDNPLEQIRLLVTHPFFTGQCPQCQHKLQLVQRVIGNSHCPACGWSDEFT